MGLFGPDNDTPCKSDSDCGFMQICKQLTINDKTVNCCEPGKGEI